MPELALVPPGQLRDRLNDCVLRGVKTATSRLLVMDEMTATPAEAPGTRMRLLGSAGETAAIVEITETLVIRLRDVGAEISEQEGDWLTDPAQWRRAHERHWSSILPRIREHLADPTWSLDDETLVVVRFFKHIKEQK